MEYMIETTEANMDTLSKDKADRLMWLGRYAERAYISLHFLRKYHDMMIDENEQAYEEFCFKMGITNRYESAEDFMYRYLYDKDNPDSMLNMLVSANDNAIVLREEITSETLSYIQLAICHFKLSAEKRDDMGDLQYLTDFLLAFWGSVDVRVANSSMRSVLKAGRFIERIDLYIRFGYPQERINQLFLPLSDQISREKSIFNGELLRKIMIQMTEKSYEASEALGVVNRLYSA